ncbi:uncharacterized protein LOC129228459 [Uloborus diversus]|uniref:uncharacterized protein LOC129228459 n=1 Tax=Uloborus diversus TaxID=327109 RepID=UPI002409532B|nr:uncharacterized protein LOC129228459 [Uloborus diversus]
MWLVIGILALLASSLTDAYGVKGGSRIVQDPAGLQGISQPHIHVGKGGGSSKLHHTAVIQDPVSQDQVLVEKVSSLGPSSAQFTLSDAQIPSFGQRRLYRVGQSQVPYGLMGSDYYSYPRNLLTSGRLLRRKTVSSNNLSGLRSIADPSLSQFQIGDAQIKTPVFGSRRNLYRSGASSVPYGLMGLDYYSYPKQLLTRRILGDGLSQTRILPGGSAFTAGDSQLRGGLDGIGQEKVTILQPSLGGPTVIQQQQVVPQQVSVLDEALGDGFGQRQVAAITGGSGFGQRQVIKTVARPAGLRGGQIILRGTPGAGIRRVVSRPVVQTSPINQLLVDGTSQLGAPIGGFGQRQAPVILTQASPVVQAVKAPVSVVSAPIRRRIVRPGDAFLSQVSRPRIAQRRVATVARPIVPVSQQRVSVVPTTSVFGDSGLGAGNIQFTLGNNQLVGGPIVAQRPVVAVSRPEVISQVRSDAGIIGNRLFGRRIPQMYYVDGGHRFPGIDIIGGSRIGDPRFNYLQLPISTRSFSDLGRRVVLTKTSPSKIGGFSGLSGLAGIGQTSPVVSQEEVIGPAGDRQVITTVTKSGPSKIGGPVIGGLGGGLSGIGGLGGPATVTQQEVIGPAGDSQLVTTVTKSGPSKIGGPVIGGFGGGLSGIGGLGGPATVTQQEVIGPAGDSQLVTTVTKSGPSKIGGPVTGGLGGGLSGIGGLGGPATVTQQEVIGPAGDSQLVTTVTKSGPSKIGGPVIGGLGGIGQQGKLVTQEEVIGPAGDRQLVTTVTKTSPSKIGGAAAGGLSGITGLGGPATITQEEVIGPAGDSQLVTTVTKSGPSKIGGPVIGGLGGIGQTNQVVTQEEVIGPAGDSQLITTVTKSGPSKIGGPVLGGLSGISGLGASTTKTITQEEVIGPAGDSQLLTTVTKSSPSKIGGPVIAGPLGLTGVGQGSPSVVTQEEVVGPAGDVQTVTTITKAAQDPLLSQSKIGGAALGSPFGASSAGVIQQEFVDPSSSLANDIIQSPIGAALAQEAGIIASPLSQSNLFDPASSVQTSVDDVIAQNPFSSDITQVKETTITKPGGIQFTPVGPVAVGGQVTKVTEVTQPISQQPISQQSISSDFGLGDYLPRVSFLSQYPYDVPGRSLLRSVLTRPIVQEQQQLEQILV